LRTASITISTVRSVHSRRSGKDRSEDVGAAGEEPDYERQLIAKPAGIEKYKKMNEPMKVELIEERADDVFSEYTLVRTSSISAAARISATPRR